MEYWSIEKRHQTFSHYSNTPVLQWPEHDSNRMRTRSVTFFWIIDPEQKIGKLELIP
jgi:hypothetical protein